MATSLINRLSVAFQNAERNLLYTFFGRPFPPPEIVYNSESHYPTNEDSTPFSLSDIIGDGYLYAVPKFRRSIERRWKRKFGYPDYYWKLLVPKKNLRVCGGCGHHHEVGVLCAHCYDKIRLETKAMNDAIYEKLDLKPIEQEVVVLYEGEKLEKPDEFWRGKRVVEMPKPRPPWFSKNLLQRTTQAPATSTDVKPTELA